MKMLVMRCARCNTVTTDFTRGLGEDPKMRAVTSSCANFVVREANCAVVCAGDVEYLGSIDLNTIEGQRRPLSDGR